MSIEPEGYAPEAGDIVWTDFDPRTGREQGGRRPALVLSPRPFWAATGLLIVCPITSKVRPFPSSAVLETGEVIGEILTSHIRSIDTLARPIRFSGSVAPEAILEEARGKVKALIGA